MITKRTDLTLPDARSRPYLVRCDAPKCAFYISTPTQEEGQLRLFQHHCPHTGGPTKIGLLMSRTLLEEAWLKLDVTLTEIKEGTYEDPLEEARLKGVCRGMAEVLAIFMKPHFETGDQIAAEAGRRYKAKKDGIADYETPGLGSRRFESAAPTSITAPPKPRMTDAQKAASRLKEEERNAIKRGMASGMFEAADLAKMYGVSTDTILAVVG